MLQLADAAKEQGAPTHWLGYIHSDDLAATTGKAKELGGNVLHEMEIPDVGSIAVMMDPQGAVITFWQPLSPPMPAHDPAPGEFAWNELATSDYEAAWSFYSPLFGWTITEDMDMGEGVGVYRMFTNEGGDNSIGGMWNKPADMPVAAWLYYARVDSCAAAAEQLVELGGTVVNGPMQVPGGDTIVQAIDPQGGFFALHSLGNASNES